MRYIVLTIIACLTTTLAMAQSDTTVVTQTPNSVEIDNNTLWQSGNQAYIDADYHRAISCYSAIENRGYYSAKLYYNLGNAYFKLSDLGHAILYYNRALKVSPSMEDARYNLTIAEGMTKDKIAVVPEFFLNRWIKTIHSSISCTAWSVISLVLLGVLLCGLLLFLLAGQIRVRKTGFYLALNSLLFFVATTAFAIAEREDILNRNQAIVISSAISVKSSPDSSATDLFVLHEGTMATISSQVDGWCEITIADGKKGWTECSHLERI